MRTSTRLAVAGLTAAVGLSTITAPVQAQISELEVYSDGFGTVADRFIIRVDQPSVAITTSVSSYGEVTEEECSFEVSDCVETYTVRLQVWNPNGNRIISETRDSDYGSDDFEYPVGLPGRYRTTATVTQYVDGDPIDQQTTSGYYQVFKQKRSRLAITRARVYRENYKWRLVGDLSVIDAPPSVDRGKKVWLIARIDGNWYDIDSASTTRRGKVGWLFKPNPYTWSMCFEGTYDKRVRGTCGRNWRTPRLSARSMRSLESVAGAQSSIR